MKILLVNPRNFYPETSGSTTTPFKRIAYPIGLMSLASAIKRIEIKGDPISGPWQSVGDPGAKDEGGNIISDMPDREVMLMDCSAEGFGDLSGDGDEKFEKDGYQFRSFGLSDEQIVEKLETENFKPDVVMVTGMFTKNLPEFYKATDFFKSEFPEATIVGGGIGLSDLDKMPTTFGRESDEVIESERKKRNEYMNDPFDNGCDIIVRGEGEITAVRLLNALEQLKNREKTGEKVGEREEFEILSQISNLVFRPSDELIEDIPQRELHLSGVYATKRENEVATPETFGELPFEDLSVRGLDRENYSADKFHAGEAKSDNWYDLHTSRGCDKQCTFCAVQPYFGCFRPLEEERLIEKLEYVKSHGYDEICIHDDSILNDPERAIRIFEMMGAGNEEKGLPGFDFDQFSCIGGIELMPLMFKSDGDEVFYVNRRAISSDDVLFTEAEYSELPQKTDDNTLDQDSCYRLMDGKEIIDAMTENGCYRIYLSLESANPETLDAIGKSRIFPEEHLRTEQDVVSYLAQSGVETHGGVMMGHPTTEGIDELMENVKFCRDMRELGLARTAFWPESALPGSFMSMSEIPVERNARVRTDLGLSNFSFDTGNIDSYAQGWTAEELLTIISWANETLNDDSGRNWTSAEGKDVLSVEELSEEIQKRFYDEDGKPDLEKLKDLTLERLKGMGNPAALEAYWEAIVEIRGEEKVEVTAPDVDTRVDVESSDEEHPETVEDHEIHLRETSMGTET